MSDLGFYCVYKEINNLLERSSRIFQVMTNKMTKTTRFEVEKFNDKEIFPSGKRF